MNLNGWDTGYATTLAEVNIALADPKAVPASFSVTAQGMAVQGGFGLWSIVPGGAGDLLHLLVAVGSGTVSGGGAATVDLAGMSVLLEINLQLLPPNAANQQALKFNFKTVGTASTPSAPGVVKPLLVFDPAKKLSFLQSAVFGACIAQSLVNQASALSFSFANINLVAPGGAGGLSSWLAPVSCAYEYYQTGAGAGYLVILSVTDSRNTDNISRKIDPELISGNWAAFFAVSEALFLRNVIQPILPKLYPGTDDSFFHFDAVGQVITSTKPIGLAGIKPAAITYNPRITAMQISVVGSTVVAVVSGDCDLYMGMSMTFSVSSTSQSSVHPVTGELSLAKDPAPIESHESHIPWYDYLMGGIPDLIMAIVVPLVADSIAGGLSSAIKGMSFASAGAQNVHWVGMKAFTVGGGQLNHDFRLWGKLA